MSRYDWESGTIKIPSKAWKPFRDALAKAYNDRQTKLHETAVKLKASLEATKKALPRGKFDLQTEFKKLCDSFAYRSVFEDDQDGDLRENLALAITGKELYNWDEKTRLKAPLKKDFPLAVSTKTLSYDAGSDGEITLDHKAMTVHWQVHDNNHAVERARDSYMGSVLFKLLARIEWTRGSGGELVGNDEYNRDNENAGGGANYVTQTYAYKSPKEKAEEARQARQLRSSFGSGYGYGYGYGRGRR